MNRTVLIVDDDALIRQGLANEFSQKGFNVLEAGNGKEGLDIIKDDDKSVDVVLTDVHMPEMDGLQMVEAIREDKASKQLPVVVLSVDETATSINQALEAGVTVYLSKTNTQPEAIVDQVIQAL